MTIAATNVSDGWRGACNALLSSRHAETTHLVVRMTQPLPESAEFRVQAEAFAAAAGHQTIAEVRNTIFPTAMAERYPDPHELAREYMEDYELRRSLAGGQGTYFGRICEFPGPRGTTVPQLGPLVERLRKSRSGTRWKAIYQINVYSETIDQEKKRGYFPCMAHLGFQLAYSGADSKRPDRLDCVALYRNQDLAQKGYGNYLGLAELQNYLAAATGFLPGELLVVAGHAELSLSGDDRRRLAALCSGTP